MKTIITILSSVVLSTALSQVYAQSNPCTSNTPTYTVDLTGVTFGTVNIGPVERDGLCCDAVSPDICIMVTITLDPNSVGFRFDITSGAVPPGSMFYQVGCGDPVKVGDIICLDGVGPHVLTFCKPGNNQNTYKITSVPRSIVPDSIHVKVGCSAEIGTLGYFIDSTLVWHDLTSSDGRYLDYLDCIKGCDTVFVTPDYNAPNYIDYEVCGNLVDTVCQDTNSYLCRRVRVFISSIKDSVEAYTCSNQAYILPDGEEADSTGQYISVLLSSEGCDSIVTTDLTVYPVFLINNDLTSCDSAMINGRWYFTSQTVIDSFNTIHGCDSVIITDLQINNSVRTFLMHTACDSAIVNNNWYFSSQRVTDSFFNIYGCDSIVYTDLTINYKQLVHLDRTACDSGQVNGNWYSNSQVIRDSFLTIDNCDSIEITNLKVNYTQRTYDEIISCDNAEINGKYYYAPQMVYDTFSTFLGCDSVVITDLITYYSTKTFQTETVCDSALIHGNWYYESQDVYDTFSTFRGCDSVVQTQLTVFKSQFTSQVINTCDSVLINGRWYTESQVVVDSFITSKGCDSIFTSQVHIYHANTVEQDTTICEGDSLLLPDARKVSQPGNYISYLINLGGCDSIVYSKVRMNYTYYKPQPDTLKCVGDQVVIRAGKGVDLVEYRWSNGINLPTFTTKELGAFSLTVTAANGCTAQDTITVADADCPACPVYTPTAFTPNFTGLNEVFRPVSECEFLEYRFEIYNRWGECLYITENPEDYWDGTYQSDYAQQDVYVWMVYYIDKKALKPILHSGTVTLIR